jgi:cell division protein ZapA (FtsZ GTPase activity inhibitor)
MEELTITVTIADRIYRLTIERKEEETVRKAARLIEEKIKEYAKNYAFKDKQDLLAMVALQFSTGSLNQEMTNSVSGKELEEKLTVIDRLLSESLDKQNVL